MAALVGAVQGIRETVERYRDELGGSDLMLACYALDRVEDDLFELWEESDAPYPTPRSRTSSLTVRPLSSDPQ